MKISSAFDRAIRRSHPRTRGTRRLAGASLPQALDFLLCKLAPLAGLDIELQRPVAHALDFFHVMPDALEHAMELAVAAFGQRDLIPRVGRVFEQCDTGGTGLHLAHATFVLFANGHAATQAI